MIPLLFVLAVAAAPSTTTTPSTSTPPKAPRGSYRIDDATAAAAVVDAAVKVAVADVVFFARPFAAATLREANAIDAVVIVDVDKVADGERIHVRFGGKDVTTIAGVATDVVVDAHGVARVVQRRDGDAIVQTAARTEGTRTLHIHAVDPAANVVDVDVRFDSPELPSALHYRLRYHRT
jgi:hypothetical protein